MGSYNDKGQKQNVEYLKEDKCPLCGNSISIDNKFRLKADTIDYHCLNCLPDGNYITITGSPVGTKL